MVQYVGSEQIDSILGAGESLEMVGVGNWALDQAGALDAVQRLSCLGVAVAGGDVYAWKNGVLELAPAVSATCQCSWRGGR